MSGTIEQGYIDESGVTMHPIVIAEIDRLYKAAEENINLKGRLKQNGQDIQELSAEIQRLKDGIKQGIDSLKDKHKAYFGQDGQAMRDQFKLGLSWGWGAFEDLIEEDTQ
jgi:hypothetical protein